MSDVNFLAGQASLWVQPNGPNSITRYLGCHSVADIAEPKGDSTLLYCPDPSQVGKFKVKNSFKGAPGTITTTIETDLRATADYLEDLAAKGCPFTLFVHKVSCGRRDVFTNFDRSFVLGGVEITTATLAKLASRNPTDEGESTQSFAVSVQEVLRVFNMECSRISISDTEDITGISTCGEDRCEGSCGAEQSPEDSLWASSKFLVGSTSNKANVLRSLYEGAWASAAADPFAAAMDIQGVVCFKLSRDDTRIIVARGTTDAGPLDIAYSDNGGVTWSLVAVGSVNTEFVSSAHSLFALDRYHIWVGSNMGRIYFSSDAGETWTLQEAAVISATAIKGISMYDEYNGMAVYTGGQVAVTSDGTSWSAAGAVSGSAVAMDVKMTSSLDAFVVGTDGMFCTLDGGDVWTKRNSNVVAAIDFYGELFGVAAGSAASAPIWMTIDGGYSWMALPAITNAGFLDVKVVSSKLAYVVGKISGGTGFIGKVQPVS
jgi:photosystem II stability/assembly factor-like uncharacterized protein